MLRKSAVPTETTAQRIGGAYPISILRREQHDPGGTLPGGWLPWSGAFALWGAAAAVALGVSARLVRSWQGMRKGKRPPRLLR